MPTLPAIISLPPSPAMADSGRIRLGGGWRLPVAAPTNR
jgi:hypothetical protein